MPPGIPRFSSVFSPRARAVATRLFVAIVVAAGGRLLPTDLHAQVPFDPNRNQAIGATAGLASGSGVSYQEILPSAWGFRGALFGWKLGDSSFIDVGLSGLRVLSDDGNRRIYLIGGTSFWRWSDEDSDAKESWGVGAGVGIEMPLATRATFAIEGVFTYWSRSEDFLPLPQATIHYLF